ncbi:sulfurtransferase-like selenium metabolism protein YedF [candidate division KSB1 bacterium]|nr:sulfurtransferase-like selenium metabolism protein YedF [candidate division KSB1 bacterium]
MTFLYLNSDRMGEGDPELGRKLMISFLKELEKSNVRVDMIGAVNSGINLTTQDGQALEILKRMEQKGAKIATCGTCLEHYKRQDDLLIGQVGTMDMTVMVMAAADRIIRPN